MCEKVKIVNDSACPDGKARSNGELNNKYYYTELFHEYQQINSQINVLTTYLEVL